MLSVVLQFKIMSIKLNDLSFSGLVGEIQHEEIKGADYLNAIAEEIEIVRAEISKSEKKLNGLKSREAQLVGGSQYIMKHLEKNYPLAVQRNGYIVVVTKENISIERNVL